MSWTIAATVTYGALVGLALVNVTYLRRRRLTAALDGGPLVSVIIPARNEAHNLRRLLPSLLGQRYAPLEVIVYDDGSEDDTSGIAESFGDERVQIMRGGGPAAGWIGKVHALFNATRQARGDVWLFLDADAELRHPDALGHLVGGFLALPRPRLLSGVPRLCGGGSLLVSMIPFWLLAAFPVPLAPVGRRGVLGVLNGQCWMIDRETYLAHEPHRAHPNEVLEDIRIGRYLKRRGAPTHFIDLQHHLSVWMYGSLADAWRGFRKNTYLVAGGHPLAALLFGAGFLVIFAVVPAMSPVGLAGLFLLKGISDRHSGFPLWTTILTPVTIVLSFLLLLDSAAAHWTGRVEWKGRRV